MAAPISRELVQAFLKAVQHGSLPDPNRLCERMHTLHDSGGRLLRTADLAMCVGSHGDTPFLTAAKHGHVELLQRLHVEFYVPLEHSNADGKTALHEAAQASREECVCYLTQAGAKVDSLKRADWTPLMLACTKPSLTVVDTLLKAGASLTLNNKDGWTPFHIACREGHADIIQRLLEEAPGCWDTSSNNGRIPLHTAALHGRLEVGRVLLTQERCTVDKPDSCGVTPLMDAARGNHPAMLSILLQFNASLCCADSLGLQAVHHASHAGATAALRLLLQEGSEVNSRASVTTITPLHYAAKEGHAETLSLLLSLGADPSLKDREGRTALDMARHARNSQAAVSVLEDQVIDT